MGCGGSTGSAARSLQRLERLVFIPAGECRPYEVDCSNPEPLLFDRYEVTREEWRAFLARGGAREAPKAERELWGSWTDDTTDWPTARMDLSEAREFAGSEGMRLPTAAEWMRVAAGTRAQRLPWGQRARSVSNSLGLGLNRPTSVGTFERGATPLGVYDLIGNVAEWVEGPLLIPEPLEGSDRTWAMGGSFNRRVRNLFEPVTGSTSIRYNALLLAPGHRSREIGLRLCATAEDYLLDHAGDWSTTGAEEARLLAVGKVWGRAAVPLLEDLSSRPDSPSAIILLLEGARR